MSTQSSNDSLFQILLALRPVSEVLSRLNDDDLRHLIGQLSELTIAGDEMLVHPGDAGERIWLVLEGRLSQTEPGMDKETPAAVPIGPGALIGEVAFASGGNHEIKVRAEETCRIATLSRETNLQLLKHHPKTWRKLSEYILEQMRKVRLGKQLDRLFGPFGKLRPYVLRELEDEVEWVTLRGGEMLFRQGDAADDAYILMTGRLRVATEDDQGHSEVISEIAAGETVGEIALLTESARTATIYAARDSELVRLSRRSFKLMLERSSKAMGSVSRILVDRLVGMISHAPRPKPAGCIALIPVSPTIPMKEFARELSAALEQFGQVALLSSKTVGVELGMVDIAQSVDSHPAHLRLTQWLQDRESTHSYLLYQADPAWTRWTERCIRQVDHLIFIGDAEEPPVLSELETRIRSPNQRASLVLLQREDTRRPTGTRHWLDERSVDAVFHVRRQNSSDYARLVRILAGRAVSLVLGGGGARGFAQVGVIQAMEELGIPIDMVGGTSIGACIGFYHARGMNATAIQAHLNAKWGSMLDYTLPLVALMAGRKINHRIVSDCAAWDIEDLFNPFYCVSANLTTTREVIHRRGNAARAIRATTSIPGVLPPVPEGEDLLIDGGVLNNLPVDIMRKLNPTGPLIAVDVVSPRGPRAKTGFGMWVSGWKVVLNRLNPFAKKVPLPGVTDIMIRSMLVGADSMRNRMLRDGLADLYLNINVAGTGMLRFDIVDPSVEKGYKSALEPLREWAEKESLIVTATTVE